MHIRKTAVVVVLTVVCGAVTLPPALARHEQGYHKKADSRQGMSLEDKFFKKAKFILRNGEEAGVSEAQLSQVRKIKIETKKQLLRTQADIDVLKVDIKSELFYPEEETDMAQIDSLIEQKYGLKKNKAKMLAAAYDQVRNILTEDQRASLKTLWKEMRN